MTLSRFIWILLVFIFVAIGGAVLYVTQELPDVPVREISIQATEERMARGAYLSNHVAVCIDCHSTRDWARFSGPIIPGTEGKGGEAFMENFGFPGNFYAPNITPFNLSNWTDGEIFRAITSGVKKDGKPIVPVMPFHNYGRMDTDDIYSIIAYIRFLQPIDNHVPESKANFPFNIIMHTIPKKPSPSRRPPFSDTLNYGRYLVNAAACNDCHTPFERGRLIMEKSFAGGREFSLPFGTLVSSNITPDMETGIGSWSAAYFIERFKTFDLPYEDMPKADLNEFQTVMPWNRYGGMSEEDLNAIYRYLQSLDPISNPVEEIRPLK
jgi:hypothetical protein